MSTIDSMSMRARAAANKHPAALACVTLGLVLSTALSAAERPMSVEYQSALADYRHFDAQAPTVAWRQANDAIGSGSEGAAQGMNGMHGPTEPAPAGTAESPPTTSADHPEYRR